ncbi:SGNH/GDSL hydrolase family protein [Clostridium oryzae]|uniref:SGNH/GDSL hydrolase family protein n=1 Tax=Clostridium oryzae TaxID=1450648 RepID=UPI001A9A69E9|nr:SGNH/GDSL hydrolase family protein [Clostridium oryzae]
MGKIILFQGDSITDGNRYKKKEELWDLNHHMGHGYAYMVNGKLGTIYTDKDLTFVNRGISGNRIVDVFARLEEDIINIKPDIISFLVGVNDVYAEIDSQSGTKPKMFEAVYCLMLDAIKERLPQSELVICEPFILPVGNVEKEREAWEAVMSPLQAIAKRVAEDYNAIFIPLQGIFNDLCKLREPSYWSWDGVHPTVCGHQIIADEWIKATKRLFE